MDEPTLIERTAQPYVAIRTSVTMDRLGEAVPPLNGEVFAWLAERGIAPAGPPFWKYDVIDMDRELVIEAGVATAEPVDAGQDPRVLSGTLPAGTYATVTHTGHPDELVAATGALLDWGAARGIVWDSAPGDDGEHWGARLELYLTDPDDEPDMTKWRTELAFRIAADSPRP
ncbi:GyrI-like domain-containing protein [Microbacterium rhizophilus]|uniref:GyrI-like domain-containing protein n=1 Tax=Microbacterium rhizophilus TaxID=3138934 RepID=UPI0031EF059C